jgi:P-type Mg2+ transporter
MEIPEKNVNTVNSPGSLSGAEGKRFSDQLLRTARADIDALLTELGTQQSGLNPAQADSRRKQFGPNEIAREKHQSVLMRLSRNIKNNAQPGRPKITMRNPAALRSPQRVQRRIAGKVDF